MYNIGYQGYRENPYNNSYMVRKQRRSQHRGRPRRSSLHCSLTGVVGDAAASWQGWHPARRNTRLLPWAIPHPPFNVDGPWSMAHRQPLKGLKTYNFREILDFTLYGSWGPLEACKILPRGPLRIPTPGEPNSENFIFAVNVRVFVGFLSIRAAHEI